ncbi:hypothetical protein G647_02917 [Cladophialophora carrionii CBS 160.54]|uniref:Major facilitator superfamily (MFS) profile domain-containing protein n=1 Tax=Cladophialophora carrionii CBS 160.54 TaxID=1279043 RepID=V9DH10_9EURO|nr:uncharacterized protein G647_02917 [Cladophialophora carrionii CBS 160.54]ETI26140.1 hypothetical protein G647_02917 [Cladophialophora carrionii CBS 160.54]
MIPGEAQLGRDEEDATESASLLHAAGHGDNRKDESRSASRLLLRIYLIVFCLSLGTQILQLAQIQVFESIYCSQWYQRHPIDELPSHSHIPESYCKIAQVQTQISTLKGWLEFFNAAPGLLLSIPMGILTDKIGRRHLIILNLSVLCLTQGWTTFVTWFGGRIPLRAICLGASLNLLSGGGIVTELLYVCILTDISPRDQVAETFFRTTAFGQFSKVLGPFMAAALMRFDPWLAVYCGLAFLVISVILATAVPETLHWRTKPQDGQSQSQEHQGGRDSNSAARKPRLLALRHLLKVWSDWRLVFVALTYPFRLVCYALGEMLQRYISDRYGWTLADATLIYSAQAVAAGLVLFTVLPLISGHIDRRFRFSIIQKNVVLSRAALLVMSAAYALIGLAPTVLLTFVGLLIETLSTGFPATLRAIATALVGDADRGRVFSVLGIAETLSIMMAYPVTAALFNIGIEKGGGPWLGLPYDVISIAAAVGFVAMCLVRFDRPVRL